MAGSVNKVILIGNLGRDPEVRSFANGGRVANLSIATSETWKDRNTGERQERTEWHRVAIFNEGLVRVAEQYLKKGAKVYLEGQLETRKWTDQNGVEKYSTEITLRPYNGELTMLDGRASGAMHDERNAGGTQGSDGPPPRTAAPASAPAPGASSAPDAQAAPASQITDDEIPF